MIMNKRKLLSVTLALASALATWAYGEQAIKENQFTYQITNNNSHQRMCIVTGVTPGNESGIIDIPQYYYDGYNGERYYEVTRIDDAAFAGNNDIKQVVNWSYQVRYYVMGDKWTPDTESLTSCSSVYTSIGKYAFKNCVNLTHITFPKTLLYINECAFAGCSSLTSISFPSAVKTIGSRAFEGCTSLSTVTVHRETPITITNDVFPNCDKMTLVVPVGCKNAYRYATGWKEFKEIVEMDFADIHIPEGYSVRTFCSTTPLDFTDVSDVRAYVFDMNHIKLYDDTLEDYYYQSFLTSRNYGTLGFRRVYQVSAGQGVLIRAKSGDYRIPRISGEMPNYEGNPNGYLVGVPYDTTVSPEEGEYVNLGLAKSYSFYFCKFSHEGTISGGKAYLHIKKGMYGSLRNPYERDDDYDGYGGYGLSISFCDDEENQITNIISVDERKVESDECYYDLQGRRVENPVNGIYIKNGKKIIIK